MTLMAFYPSSAYLTSLCPECDSLSHLSPSSTILSAEALAFLTANHDTDNHRLPITISDNQVMKELCRLHPAKEGMAGAQKCSGSASPNYEEFCWEYLTWASVLQKYLCSGKHCVWFLYRRRHTLVTHCTTDQLQLLYKAWSIFSYNLLVHSFGINKAFWVSVLPPSTVICIWTLCCCAMIGRLDKYINR